jgi:hypothetical protein
MFRCTKSLSSHHMLSPINWWWRNMQWMKIMWRVHSVWWLLFHSSINWILRWGKVTNSIEDLSLGSEDVQETSLYGNAEFIAMFESYITIFYPEPDESTPLPHHISVKFTSLHLLLCHSSDLLPLGFFLHGATAPSGPGPPDCRGFTITLRHTTLGRTPLDEWSARRRDLYLTTHNTHKRHPCPGGIRTRNPNKGVAADPRLRPRGHWDRHL